MSERDFKVGSYEFKLSKIDAFKQFHIVRRLSPILGDLAPHMNAISKLSQKNGKSEAEKFDELAGLLKPILDGIAKLSDADANLVLFGLLSGVEIKQSTGHWAYVVRDSVLMFNDLDLPTLLAAAGKSLAYNLSGFFAVLPQK